jgi:diguanylate cyclase (GGDEF)-like protein
MWNDAGVKSRRIGWLYWFLSCLAVAALLLAGWQALPAWQPVLSLAATVLAAGTAIAGLLKALRWMRRSEERGSWQVLVVALFLFILWRLADAGLRLLGHPLPTAWGLALFAAAQGCVGLGLLLRRGWRPRSLLAGLILICDLALTASALALLVVERNLVHLLLPLTPSHAPAWTVLAVLAVLGCGLLVTLDANVLSYQRGSRWALVGSVALLWAGDAALWCFPLIAVTTPWPVVAVLWILACGLCAMAAQWEVDLRPASAVEMQEGDAFLASYGILVPLLLLLAGVTVLFTGGMSVYDRAVPLLPLLGGILIALLLRVLALVAHSRHAYTALLQRVRVSEQEAVTDPLTNLPNKRACRRRLQDEVVRAIRYRRPLAVLFTDLDFFKLINDVHGHDIGDLALCAAADCLLGRIRTTDMVARWGGEEFMLILPETSFEQADILAERLRIALSEVRVPLPDGTALTMTMSVGLAAYPETSDTVEKLVHDADAAMNRAKGLGRNRVEHAYVRQQLFVYEDRHAS